MASQMSWTRRVTLCVILPALSASCGSMVSGLPVRSVSHCTLAWDQVENQAVAEYRVAVWPAQTTAGLPQKTVRVKAPTTAVPCKTAGASYDGTWQATVQACTKITVCSEPSMPLTFVVSAK